MKRRIVFFATLAVCASLFSQDQDEGGSSPLRVMTRVSVASRIASMVPAEEEWAASLDTALIRNDRVSAVRRLPADADPSVAAAEAFDLVVDVKAAQVSTSAPSSAPSDERIRVVVLFFETATGKIIYRSDELILAPREAELAETFWLPLEAEIERIQPYRPMQDSKTAEKRLDRSLNSQKAVVRPATWSLESALYMGQFADFWMGRSFFADRLRVKAGAQQFWAGFALLDEDGAAPLVSFPLVQPGVGVDVEFLRIQAFALYASAAASVRISTVRITVDPIAPMMVLALAGAELVSAGPLALFIESGLSYYPFCDGFLAASSAGANDRGVYGNAYGDGWFIEFPQFRVGVRLRI